MKYSSSVFLRYVNQGGNTALQDNEARLKELKERAEKLKKDKEAVSNEIDKLKNDISKQQVSLVHSMLSYDRSYLRVMFAIGWAQDNNRSSTTATVTGVNPSRERCK